MKVGKFIKGYLKQSFQKSHVITGVVLAFLVGSVLVYAGQLTNDLIEFQNDTTADAMQVNYNFQLLSDAVDVNREGFACEMTSEGTMSATPVNFVCDSMLADYADYSLYTGSYLFEPTETGVYQIHRSILVASDSDVTPYVDTMYDKLYLDGTEVYNQEYFKLTPGQYVELKLVDTSGSNPWYRSGSMVFVKRIF